MTIFALGLLAYLLLRTDAGDRFRIFALSLVLTGALGNLIDRVRWDRGVVDFIGPIDLGFMDFPIFNVADMAISCGAVALAISFWMEEAREGKDSGGLPAEGDSEAHRVEACQALGRSTPLVREPCASRDPGRTR